VNGRKRNAGQAEEAGTPKKQGKFRVEGTIDIMKRGGNSEYLFAIRFPGPKKFKG
jgi:hypothetical protein